MKLLSHVVVLISVILVGGCTKAATTTSSTTATTPVLGPAAVFSTGQAASHVTGQTDFVSNASGVSVSTFATPSGVSVTSTGILLVAEQSNSRVLGFNSVPTISGASADFVVGQTSFTFPGTGAASNQLTNPQGVASGGTQMFVADFANYRVLIYNALVTNSQAAVAVGQISPSNGNDPGSAGVSPTTLRFPSAVFVSGTKMAIADSGYNRVVLYNTIPTTSNTAFDTVIGQTNKYSGASGVATMALPSGVWTDGTKVAVCDLNHHRVLLWNSWPAADGAVPDVVLGQPNLNSVTANYGGISAKTMANPYSVYSNGTELFVSDGSNNRILYWKTWPTSSQQAADVVLGQPDFVSSTAGTSAALVNDPRGLYLTGSTLLVADAGNNRVLSFIKN